MCVVYKVCDSCALFGLNGLEGTRFAVVVEKDWARCDFYRRFRFGFKWGFEVDCYLRKCLSIIDLANSGKRSFMEMFKISI